MLRLAIVSANFERDERKNTVKEHKSQEESVTCWGKYSDNYCHKDLIFMLNIKYLNIIKYYASRA